jgi:hypothetical protein
MMKTKEKILAELMELPIYRMYSEDGEYPTKKTALQAMEAYASQSPIPAEVIEQVRKLKNNGGFMNADAIVAMTIDRVLSILESHNELKP